MAHLLRTENRAMWNDFKFAVRCLRKNVGFTLIAALTLALGTGANTAIFSVIDAVLLKPLPFRDAQRIVTLWESNPARGVAQEPVTPPNFVEWQKQNRVFDAIGYWTAFDANLVLPDGVRRVHRAHVSSEIFGILGVAPLLGRGFAADEDQENSNRSAVVSYGFWQSTLGGRHDVIGQSLTVDTYGRRDYTIVGVMPGGFSFPDQTELWLNAGWNGIPRERQGHWLNVLARLKAGVAAEQARAELNTIQAQLAAAQPRSLIGTSVTMARLPEFIIGPRLKPALLLLWGVVAGVMLIACANVANLLLARAVSRRREMTVRSALGASPARIVRQLLIEGLTLSFAGGILGGFLGWWTLQLLIPFAPADIARLNEVHFDWRALLFTFGISTLSGIVFALAPAWQFSGASLERSLREAGHSTSASRSIRRLRGALVISEIAVSLLLLIGAALMIDAFRQIVEVERGFDPEQVITAELDFSVSGYTTWVRATETRPQIKLKQLLDNLSNQPGVKVAAAASSLPRRDSGPPNQPFYVVGRPQETAYRADYTGVSPNYFSALQIPVLRGRVFTEDDKLETPPVIIINENLAKRYFGNEDPIGKRLSMSRNPNIPDNRDLAPGAEIVGVVADVKRLGISGEAQPEVYVPYWQWPMLTPVAIIRGRADAAALATVIRSEIKSTIPNLAAPNVKTMNAILSEIVAQPRFQSWLLSAFGGLAVLLAAIGLYGTLAYLVANRAREIGIRMALGAQRYGVISLILRDGFKLVALGTLVGTILTAISTQLLANSFFGVTPNAIGPGVAGACVLLVVAFVACWIPARHATNINPVEALRLE